MHNQLMMSNIMTLLRLRKKQVENPIMMKCYKNNVTKKLMLQMEILVHVIAKKLTLKIKILEILTH
jgi:hypothetical protein